MKEKFLIIGSGGREASFAANLAIDSILYAIMTHANPTIITCVKKSNGKYLIANTNCAETIKDFAIKHKIDYVFISADDPLANGVIDDLLKHNIKAVGGTKAATKIEWDKIYSIETMYAVCPEFTPFYIIVSDLAEIKNAVNIFKEKKISMVVKPQGLTGGKGVKVMPEHLPDYDNCIAYALELLKKSPREKVLLVEKIIGIEFTIMGFTDGKHIVNAPATYDYPFRFENDTGPGTGGMGCWSNNTKKLPFMTDKDLSDCKYIMQRIVDDMSAKNLFFNGILNGGFFKTKNGIRFMEFNARFGDPEALNILSVLQTPLSKVIKSMWHKNISKNNVIFTNKVSVIKYLVAKDYPDSSKDVIKFIVDENKIIKSGVNILYAACTKISDNVYQTIKSSRVVALVAIADNISIATTMIDKAIDNYITSTLEYRKDIATVENLNKITILINDK